MADLPLDTQELSIPPNSRSNKSQSGSRSYRDEDWPMDSFQITATTPLLNRSSDENLSHRRCRLPKFKPILLILIFGGILGLTGIYSVFSFSRHLKPCNDHFLIMFIRHSEKDLQNGISKLGHCRARMIASLFNGKTFPEPQILATWAPGSHRLSLRGIQTFIPISHKLHIDINTYKNSKHKEMMDDIVARACGRTVLIAWHHNSPSIGDLLLDLGVNLNVASGLFLKYGRDYDAVWMVRYNGENLAPNITMGSEGLGMNPCESLEV